MHSFKYWKKFEILWSVWKYGEDDNNGSFYNYDSLEVDFEEEIHSISFSLDKTKIYLCLSNKKMIKIWNWKEEIKSKLNEQKDYFIKCMELKTDLLAVSDDDSNNVKKY